MGKKGCYAKVTLRQHYLRNPREQITLSTDSRSAATSTFGVTQLSTDPAFYNECGELTIFSIVSIDCGSTDITLVRGRGLPTQRHGVYFPKSKKNTAYHSPTFCELTLEYGRPWRIHQHSMVFRILSLHGPQRRSRLIWRHFFRRLQFFGDSFPIVKKGESYSLQQDIIREWQDLEIALRFIATKLLSHSRVRLPLSWDWLPYPSQLGYPCWHKKHTAAIKCSRRSRDAFLALAAAVSLGIILFERTSNVPSETSLWFTYINSLGIYLYTLTTPSRLELGNSMVS